MPTAVASGGAVSSESEKFGVRARGEGAAKRDAETDVRRDLLWDVEDAAAVLIT